jgi:hypothetical protein
MTTSEPCDAEGRTLRGGERVTLKDFQFRTGALIEQRSSDPGEEYWAKWRAFILDTVAEHAKAWCLAAVDVAMEEDVKVCTATKEAREKALEPLRAEIAALKNEIAGLRGELKTRSAFADMEERLARLEAPVPGVRRVG